MVLDIKAPETVILTPIITVFGIGGAGVNAVNNMIKSNLNETFLNGSFVVANTDAQALEHSESNKKIQLGVSITKGLGAGASPDVGRESAIESENEIRSQLEGSNMVFITAGMGGGTGTGASPIVAKIAKELGILTVGVVTKPFLFEGPKRMRIADRGLIELQKHVDTLIVIPNQNLFRVANEDTTFQQAFEKADDVLHAGVRSITDLITAPGLVNLDFADIKTVMIEKGKAMMGTGEASGEERAIKAAESAIANPLLDQTSMCGASGVLINITGGKDMTLYEVDSAANRIREEVGETDANIMFGSTFNPDLEGTIRVSVVATGIEQDSIEEEDLEDNLVINNEMQDNEISNITLDHKTDLMDDNNIEQTISIEDHEPPSYTEDDENKIKDIKNFQSQIDSFSEDDKLNDPHTTPSSANTNTDKVITSPPSLLSRLWNSLMHNDNVQSKSQKSPIDPVLSSPSDDNTNYSSKIQDKPRLFKKD